jgi:hypothetical protein
MKKFAALLLAAVLLGSLSACVNQAPLSQKALNDTSAPVPHATTIPLASVKTVKSPWVTGDMQKGIQVYWHTNHDAKGIVKAKADRILDYIVDLGANSVAISFPIYVDGPKPTRVYAGDGTPSTTELGIVIHEAQKRKLRVMLRPIIDETNITKVNPNSWRGAIVPRNVSAWFNSYETVLAPYVQLGVSDNIAEFVLGTELSSLQDKTAQWTSMQAALSADFTESNSVVLSYADNWDAFQKHDYGPFTNLGVDAYPQFPQLSDAASVAELTAAWTQWVSSSSTPSAAISLQEVGIPAQSGAYAKPFSWGKGKANNQTVQASWFTAACNAAKQTKLAGIYYWSIDINTDPLAADPTIDPSSSFIGRLGQDSIQQCFTSQ